MTNINFKTISEFIVDPSIQKPDSLIDGLIHRQELHLLVAPAKAGKSFLATQLGICLASGRDFLKQKCAPKRIAMLQTEVSQYRLKERFESIAKELKVDPKNLDSFLLVESGNHLLILNQGWDEFKEGLKSLKADLLILDPFYTLHQGDENASRDIVRPLTELSRITKNLNMGILLVHHEGKASENSRSRNVIHAGRGSSSFADIPDGIWRLNRKEENLGYLNLSFRNLPHRSFSLKFEGRLWSVAEKVFILVELIKKGEEVSKSELRERYFELTGKKQSSFDREISETLKAKKIERFNKGKEAFFRLSYVPTNKLGHMTNVEPNSSFADFQETGIHSNSNDPANPKNPTPIDTSGVFSQGG